MSEKIIFFCIPAHGHTNPTLAVVKELVARGHEVWYYSYDTMKEKIETTGAKHISCDIDIIMSVGELIDLKELGQIPSNFRVCLTAGFTGRMLKEFQRAFTSAADQKRRQIKY